jgi:hypothetical protein
MQAASVHDWPFSPVIVVNVGVEAVKATPLCGHYAMPRSEASAGFVDVTRGTCVVNVLRVAPDVGATPGRRAVDQDPPTNEESRCRILPCPYLQATVGCSLRATWAS